MRSGSVTGHGGAPRGAPAASRGRTRRSGSRWLPSAHSFHDLTQSSRSSPGRTDERVDGRADVRAELLGRRAVHRQAAATRSGACCPSWGTRPACSGRGRGRRAAAAGRGRTGRPRARGAACGGRASRPRPAARSGPGAGCTPRSRSRPATPLVYFGPRPSRSLDSADEVEAVEPGLPRHAAATGRRTARRPAAPRAGRRRTPGGRRPGGSGRRGTPATMASKCAWSSSGPG